MADPDVSREQQGEACRFVELDRDRIFAHHSVVAVGKINAVGVAAVVVVVVLVDMISCCTSPSGRFMAMSVFCPAANDGKSISLK